MIPQNPRRASLKGLYAALLISTIEQLLLSINALPLSLLILAEKEHFEIS